MIPVFFEPYDDEFYYGWLHRLAKSNGFSSVNQFFKCFEYDSECFRTGGKKKWIRFEPDLTAFHKLYSDNSTTFNEKTFLSANTLFSIDSLTHYAREFSIKACNILYGSHIYREKYSYIKSFHFCPICAQEDHEAGHSAYYRTWHQHPSCLVCAKHNVALLETTIPDLESALFNEEFRHPKDFSDEIYEQRISEWFYRLYKKPVGIDLFLLRYILADELMSMNNGRNGSIKGIAKAFKMCGTTLENRPYTVGAKRSLNALNRTEVLYVACFVLLYDSFFSKAEYYQRNFIDIQFQAKSEGNLDIIEAQGALYKVRCPKCGRSVVMYNQPFANDFKCPFCYTFTNSRALANLLKYTGSGQYRLLRDNNTASQMKYKCEVCGYISKKGYCVNKLSPLSSLCSCGKSIKGIAYFNTMNSAEIYESIEKFMGRETPLEIKKDNSAEVYESIEKSTGCETPSEIKKDDSAEIYESVEKSTGCETPSEIKKDTTVLAKKQVVAEPQYISYDHDGYTVHIYNYQVILLHQLCGTYSMISREDYQGRGICYLCYPLYEFEQIRDILIRYSGEHFKKIKQCGNKKSIEMTLMDGRELVLDSERIIKELTDSSRDSLIFPNKREIAWTQSIYSKVYCAIRDYCQQHDGTWEKGNQIEVNVAPEFLNKILKFLLRHHYLRMIDGKYSLSKTLVHKKN